MFCKNATLLYSTTTGQLYCLVGRCPEPFQYTMRCNGLMLRGLDVRLRSLRSSPGWGQCVACLRKTLLRAQCLSQLSGDDVILQIVNRGILTDCLEVMCHELASRHIQEGVTVLLAASYFRNKYYVWKLLRNKAIKTFLPFSG